MKFQIIKRIVMLIGAFLAFFLIAFIFYRLKWSTIRPLPFAALMTVIYEVLYLIKKRKKRR